MNQNMVNEEMKTAFDISREFDIPFNKVLNDLDKLHESGNYNDSELLDELEYYYKCRKEGWN